MLPSRRIGRTTKQFISQSSVKKKEKAFLPKQMTELTESKIRMSKDLEIGAEVSNYL